VARHRTAKNTLELSPIVQQPLGSAESIFASFKFSLMAQVHVKLSGYSIVARPLIVGQGIFTVYHIRNTRWSQEAVLSGQIHAKPASITVGCRYVLAELYQ
jgi:hypothetical protein